ncbi:hypothetical protein P5673_019494 [Acropora cervicornis]|uniref:Uncharacterized protein n=1 Tax=Acropora cervicornis TaxID=6130 RepID=A0AAD9QBQ3_ACRCE|nr:hypothetical protein P5673_019494 [Acropora cervicornis]
MSRSVLLRTGKAYTIRQRKNKGDILGRILKTPALTNYSDGKQGSRVEMESSTSKTNVAFGGIR